jgi:hypothetical protein
MKNLVSIIGFPVAALLSMLALPQMGFAYSCAVANSLNPGESTQLFLVCVDADGIAQWEVIPVDQGPATTATGPVQLSSWSLNGVTQSGSPAFLTVQMTTAVDCSVSTGLGDGTNLAQRVPYTISSTGNVTFNANSSSSYANVCFVGDNYDNNWYSAGSPIVWKFN